MDDDEEKTTARNVERRASQGTNESEKPELKKLVTPKHPTPPLMKTPINTNVNVLLQEFFDCALVPSYSQCQITKRRNLIHKSA